MRRIGARFLGLGFIGYPIVSPAAIAMSSEITAGWWVPLSIVMSVVPGLMLVVASFRSGTRWLGPLALGTWCAYLGTVGLWFLAWDGSTLSDSAGTAQWMIAFCGMPSMVLMLVHPGLAALSLLTSSGLAHVSPQMGRFGHLTADLPFEVLWSFVFTSVFLAVVLVAIRTGRTLDETQEDAYRSAANAAAATAREAEKARSALDELECVPDRYDAAPVSASEALRRIRSAAAGISERIDVQVVAIESPGEAGDHVEYPFDVVAAIVEAMSEALRNVMRHAGRGADCGVIVQFAPDALNMAVVDNGEGFDPEAIGPGRLGIAVSIRGRMARVDGGHAQISSHPGRGTTVQIGWTRP
ncbi:sensor histidine kinase [Gordonia paraffinivorans]|uniref:sensor histidine kinase n=1 Tax=Gordonia paraffinivorans TaxID=175628 RepID=UPI0014469695|nr:ATP-binding protein [Gordonia paraffinivorans]